MMSFRKEVWPCNKNKKESGERRKGERKLCLPSLGLVHCLLTDWNVNLIWLTQPAVKSWIHSEILQISLPASARQKAKNLLAKQRRGDSCIICPKRILISIYLSAVRCTKKPNHWKKGYLWGRYRDKVRNFAFGCSSKKNKSELAFQHGLIGQMRKCCTTADSNGSLAWYLTTNCQEEMDAEKMLSIKECVCALLSLLITSSIRTLCHLRRFRSQGVRESVYRQQQ